MSVTGEFAVKDFNVYLTNDTEDDLITENKYVVNSRIPSGPWNYIEPYDDVVPAAFLSVAQTENTPFAFGGTGGFTASTVGALGGVPFLIST